MSAARVAVAQSSSLNLFSNRDAELEQRAMLLKRLAFTIYSSEVDQYQKYLPDIQGKHAHADRHAHKHTHPHLQTQTLLRRKHTHPSVFKYLHTHSGWRIDLYECVCFPHQSGWWRVFVCPRCPSSMPRCSCSSEFYCCACLLNTSPHCGPPWSLNWWETLEHTTNIHHKKCTHLVSLTHTHTSDNCRWTAWWRPTPSPNTSAFGCPTVYKYSER